MSRCVYYLVLLFSIFRRGLSTSSAVTVTPGENVTLHCNLEKAPSTEVGWYRHSNDELTMIISVSKGNLDKELAVNYNDDPEHFLPRLQNDTGHAMGASLRLIIVDIRQSDIGLYYCGARQDGSVTFARAVYLHFTDAVKYTPEGVQCWTPLASVCCALVLMLTLCLGVVYKRGLPLSSIMKCVQNDDMKESDLQYASLRHNAAPRERHAPSANHNVTYDTVAKKVDRNSRV